VYHIACLEADDEDELDRDPWLFQDCKNAESSQQSYGSEEHWEVFGIKDKHIEMDDNGNETARYLIIWAGNRPDGRSWTLSWEPEEYINKDGDLWKKYIESVEAAY
jgi:hypothetical protein